jgi:hypothetical protein
MKKYNALVLYDPDTGKFPCHALVLSDDISDAKMRPNGADGTVPDKFQQIAPNCRWVKVLILMPETFGEAMALNQNDLQGDA